jgi:hypothetical protein
MKWGQCGIVVRYFWERRKLRWLAIVQFPGHERDGFYKRTRVFHKITYFYKEFTKKNFCTRDRALTRDSGSTRGRKSILYSIFLKPQRIV